MASGGATGALVDVSVADTVPFAFHPAFLELGTKDVAGVMHYDLTKFLVGRRFAAAIDMNDLMSAMLALTNGSNVDVCKIVLGAYNEASESEADIDIRQRALATQAAAEYLWGVQTAGCEPSGGMKTIGGFVLLPDPIAVMKEAA